RTRCPCAVAQSRPTRGDKAYCLRARRPASRRDYRMPADRAQLAKVAALLVPSDAAWQHLGTGGFASTFRVDPFDGDSYALKIVDGAQSGVERTDRELAALQRVEHPNIVGYRDAGTVPF